MKKLFLSKKVLIGGAVLGVIFASGAFYSGQSNLALAADQVSGSSTIISDSSEKQAATKTEFEDKTKTTIIGWSAEIIGITPAALQEEIKNGKTIAEVATSNGISEEVLVPKMVENVIQNADIEEMTPEEYQEYKDTVATKMHMVVNNIQEIFQKNKK